jgi:hypothetical protein
VFQPRPDRIDHRDGQCVIGGLIFAVKGGLGRRRGDSDARWWGVSALILAIPPVALIILA